MPPQAITAAREIEVREPSGVVKRKHVTNHRLDRAARELNLINVNARGLQNVATIGQFLSEVGLLRYGQGKLLGSAEMISNAANLCLKFAEKDDINEETRRGYLELHLRFIKALDANVELQLEVSDSATMKEITPVALPTKPFLPGAQISPIQVNVNVGGAQTTVKKVEEPCPSQS